jgi:signal transduction histidine kinase
MATLIEDIRDLVRLGQDSVETEPVGLDAAARTAWQTVDTSGGTLRTDGQTTVEADPDLLAQLFENLYGNAVEHGSTNPDSQTRRDAVGQASDEPSVADAPEDAVEHGSTSPGSQTRQDAAEHGSTDPDPGHTDSGVTVTVGAIDGGGFYVADDGPGIPPEEREAVFDLGVSENGTGLGLAIVRRIADAHDWTATVTESETGGARFEFRPAPDAADPDTTVSPR